MTHFVARFSRRSSIIDILHSSKYASGILQKSYFQNHLCRRPFCCEIVEYVYVTRQPWTTSRLLLLSPEFISLLVQILFKIRFTSQILYVFRNPVMKSYLMNSKDFDFRIMLFQEIDLIKYVGYFEKCELVFSHLLFIPS